MTFIAALAAKIAESVFGGWLSSAWAFLKAVPWQIYVALFAIIAALLLWHTHTTKMAAYYNAAWTEGARAATAKFTAAQAKADTAARARVKVTVAAQDKISTEVSNAYHDSTDAIDARAAQLSLRHDQAALARQRASGSSNPGTTSETAAGACPAPTQDGLPWAVAFPAMTQAAKDLDQLNKVLDWEEQQQARDALDSVE